MELKEIWEQEAKNYPATAIRDRSLYVRDYNSFLAGCEFEHNRSHWFDPEKVLPPKSPHIYSSIRVLVKLSETRYKSAIYHFIEKEWSIEEDEEVISWAYIPN